MNVARILLLAIGLVPLVARPQQWYCQNENEGEGMNYNCSGGMAFIAGGKIFFGLGLDYSNQPSGFFQTYDSATNTLQSNLAFSPGPRAYGTGFGIGNNAYIGLGMIDDSDDPYPPLHQNFFLVFDANTGNWVNQVDFPGGLRRNAIAFTIGNVAYVGGGQSVDSIGSTAQFTSVNDFWAYDQTANTWTPKANLPTTFTTARAFTVNGKGYLMRDNSASLWEYDPIANTWITRASFPGGARTGFSAFGFNGLGYVGCGRTTTDLKDFYAFNPATNSWSAAPALWSDFGRSHALAVNLAGSAYLLGGQRGATPIRDGVWRFGPSTTPAPDTWIQRPFLPATARHGSIAFSIGTKGYVGGGEATTDFWEYDPATMQWTARAPLPGTVDEGFSIDGIGYVTRPTAAGNFHAYDPTTNSWSPRADLPGGARSGAASFALEGKGYVCSGTVNGSAQSDLWEYDPATDAWTQRTNRPTYSSYNAMGLAIGNKGYVMGGSVNSSVDVSANHQYDPATDTWTNKASVPFGGRRNAQAFAIGNVGYLGGGWAGSGQYAKRFDVYDPATNSWTLLGDLGGLYRHYGVGFAIGDKGYVCGGRRSMETFGVPGSSQFYTINDLWEFNPTTIELDARVVLDGPFDSDTELMNDDLRIAGLLPVRDPYGQNGYAFPGGNYSDLPNAIPAAADENAVVDRIVVELRNASAPAQVVATRHVWLQSDGDIVDMDGGSPVRFTLAQGNYHVAVRHRNHLGVMSAAPIAFGAGAANVDLSSPGTATYGTAARKVEDGTARMWCGDVTSNGQVKYIGGGNDRDPILTRVGGLVPTNTATGYFPEDVDLDGVVKYAGASNDRDRVLGTIGGSAVTGSRTAQLP